MSLARIDQESFEKEYIEKKIPELECSLSIELFVDPVYHNFVPAKKGDDDAVVRHTFEREKIEEWLITREESCPTCRRPLKPDELMVDEVAKERLLLLSRRKPNGEREIFSSTELQSAKVREPFMTYEFLTAAKTSDKQLLEFKDYFAYYVTCADAKGNTGLHFAAFYGNVDSIRLLLENGSNLELNNKSGKTPLMMAICSGNTDAVDLLLEAGAQLDAKSSTTGQTALFDCIENMNLQMMKHLLLRGADINERDKLGNTVLHEAMKLPRNQVIIKALMNAGADFSAVNDRGENPLQAVYLSKDSTLSCAANTRVFVDTLNAILKKNARDSISFESFKKAYMLDYDTAFFKNPFSSMLKLLEKDRIKSMPEVFSYANQSTNNRTNRVIQELIDENVKAQLKKR